ncbi:hypothetical protein LguiA_030327 [Lonicera macranthoides]
METIDVTEIFKGDEEMESNSKANLKDDYEVDGENYFENDYIASGNPIFNFEEVKLLEMEFNAAASTNYSFGDCTEDFDLSLMIQLAEKESDRVSQSLRSRRDAKILENLETEALMQQWGLNEKAFQYSLQMSFFSVYVYPEEPPGLPLLGKGLGPIVQTKVGGFLRSMSPLLFKNAKDGESLIMQVSCPVVLPKAMGSSGIEILQCWALVGIEKMYMQINDLMPLDDITGKTIPQVALETLSRFEEIERFVNVHGRKQASHTLHLLAIDLEKFLALALTPM